MSPVMSSSKEDPPSANCRTLKPHTKKNHPLTPGTVNLFYLPTGRAEFIQTIHGFHPAFQCLQSTKKMFGAALPFLM